MLYIIGTGLDDFQDLTLRALSALTHSTHIFIDTYTSTSNLDLTHLSTHLNNKKITHCCRDYIESLTSLYTLSQTNTVSLLVIGTPFFATTHSSLICECIKRGISYSVIHNSGINNVMGACGLFSYNFGRTVSIPRFTAETRFTSFYDYIRRNYEMGLHTLCLLDIKTSEDYYMMPDEAVRQVRMCGGEFEGEYKIFVVSRFGCGDEEIRYVRLEEVEGIEFGKPLHSLIFPGKLEVYEEECVEIMMSGKEIEKKTS